MYEESFELKRPLECASCTISDDVTRTIQPAGQRALHARCAICPRAPRRQLCFPPPDCIPDICGRILHVTDHDRP